VTGRERFRRAGAASATLAAACLLGGCAAGTLPAVHSEPERLELARRMEAKGDYIDATELYKTYVANNAGSTEVDHAVYQLGRCYEMTKDWASASVEFERLLREFPESDSSGAASFRLGEALYGQARPPDFDQEFTQKALDQWRSYLAAYPGHWLNDDARHRVQLARMRLATKLVNTGDLYVKLRDLEPARSYYRRIESDYDDLPQLGDAWVGMARIDVLEHHPATAIERLKKVQTQFAGRPVATLATRELARLHP
jgi:outer membrane protein assembly factor BamD